MADGRRQQDSAVKKRILRRRRVSDDAKEVWPRIHWLARNTEQHQSQRREAWHDELSPFCEYLTKEISIP